MTKTDFNQLYTDLKDSTAQALREARIQPDQLVTMADGELLAIEGVTPAVLEEIRSIYPADLQKADEKTEKKASKSTQKETETKEVKGDHPRLKHPRFKHGRSAQYQAKKQKVEDKSYPISDAVSLLRKVSYGKLKTVELHLNVREVGARGELTLPFSTGKESKVEIFTPELAASIKAGKINFDILLATPADMPKIAPLAKVLGPKGLMPNPKSNTIVEDPIKRKEQLTKGATLTYRTEPKAPVIHVAIANLDLKDKEIEQNITATITAIGIGKIKSAFLKSTMSPSVKLDLSGLK